jgi:multiple sugar transport system substrate-binding protein
MRLTRTLTAALVATITAFAAACSGTTGDSHSPGPVDLTFWSGAPGTPEIVAKFNATHPNIQVKHTDAGGGTESSAKLLTAARAGNAPDVALIENTSLPRMIVAGVPRDISSDVADIKDKFTAGAWAQTTFDGHTFGVPQDVGPMALLYRKDVFDKYGVKAPLTWDDYRKAAATIKAKAPGLTMATLSTDGWGWYAAVAAQAGDDWWSLNGDTWTVNIDGPGSRKVMEFFQGMYDDKLIAADPLLNPTYNKQINDGTMLSWPSAAWAPGVIYGVAPKTAGKWELAPLPRWDAANPTVSYQGGSSAVVTKGSKHPKQAAEFIKWLNASAEGAKLILTVQNGYPAATSGQEDAKNEDPPKLMPQQKNYYQVVAQIAQHTRPVTWGPDTDVAASAFTDAMNAAVRNKTSWSGALTATQQAVMNDMRKQGFKVNEGSR